MVAEPHNDDKLAVFPALQHNCGTDLTLNSYLGEPYTSFKREALVSLQARSSSILISSK